MSLSFRNALCKTNPDRKILINLMTWFGADGHVSGYRSDSPWVVREQLSMYQDAGCDGVIATCGGLAKPIQIAAARLMCEQAEQLKMLFMLLLDHTIIGKSMDGTGVTAQLLDPMMSDIFNSSAYIPERYVVDFDFNESFKTNGATQPQSDLAVSKLYASMPKLSFQRRHVGLSWPEWQNTLATLKADNANPSMVLPGVMWDFNDSVMQPDGKTVQSVWGGNARIVDPRNGGMFFDCTDLIPTTSKYVHIVTGNDLQEGTGKWEGILRALTNRRF